MYFDYLFLILWWLENLLYTFKMCYGPTLWSVLINDLCVFEKNVYCHLWEEIILSVAAQMIDSVFQFYVFIEFGGNFQLKL